MECIRSDTEPCRATQDHSHTPPCGRPQVTLQTGREHEHKPGEHEQRQATYSVRS